LSNIFYIHDIWFVLLCIWILFWKIFYWKWVVFLYHFIVDFKRRFSLLLFCIKILFLLIVVFIKSSWKRFSLHNIFPILFLLQRLFFSSYNDYYIDFPDFEIDGNVFSNLYFRDLTLMCFMIFNGSIFELGLLKPFNLLFYFSLTFIQFIFFKIQFIIIMLIFKQLQWRAYLFNSIVQPNTLNLYQKNALNFISVD